MITMTTTKTTILITTIMVLSMSACGRHIGRRAAQYQNAVDDDYDNDNDDSDDTMITVFSMSGGGPGAGRGETQRH